MKSLVLIWVAAVSALLLAADKACALIPVNSVDSSYSYEPGTGYAYTYSFILITTDQWALPFYADPSTVITSSSLPNGWSMTVETDPTYWSSIYNPSSAVGSYGFNVSAYASAPYTLLFSTSTPSPQYLATFQLVSQNAPNYTPAVVYNNYTSNWDIEDPWSPSPLPATVPEPCSLAVWSLLGALGIAIGWWRSR